MGFVKNEGLGHQSLGISFPVAVVVSIIVQLGPSFKSEVWTKVEL